MKTPSPVLETLALRYERSQAGRTGQAKRDVLVPLEELLVDAGCSEGEKRALAEQQLAEAEAAGILTREPLHKRDRQRIHQIRFSPANESALYARLGKSSPAQLRTALVAQFAVAASANLPVRWRENWQSWCERMRQAALAGGSVVPFDREPTKANAELLALLPKLLAWQDESLVRFASCVLCGQSKQLEELAVLERDGEFAGQLRGKLGRLLEDITGGVIRTLDDVGIVPNPRSVLVHGPLKLRLNGSWMDLSLLHGPFRLSQTDIDRAEAIETTASHCLTIENETSFHELSKLQSGELLVCTSFPGSATVTLLRRLPPNIECWHFGDSDEAGFEILRVLAEKTGRNFRPLHMQAGRIPCEQESFGRPTQPAWPFYG
ncbi:MAG TPA: Wadjet anti-phage system protein JetD domain-containing protein [Candidatus Sulfotelmatobacter sp.]|nr:Wadjet anti-phage system protein JetD domain-containing protein [Candidatus Sulfotelmatobacter sp.]